ncbi:unnamed protein product [Ectocarpus sp. CCAP 1310/34]|nr:unnamed protein product [Ectocarpus sp. CCAP 1310/34]
MGLNPNAPVWTPGQGSSGEHGEGGGMIPHRVARTARERRQGRLVRVATYNVRTLAVNGANGYGRADKVLHEAAKQDISFVGLQEVRRPGRTEFTASGFRVFTCGTDKGGTHGVGIAVEEALCKASQYTTEYVDERLMAMRFEMTGHRGAVNFVAAYAPTDVATADSKRMFWEKLDSLVRRIPAKEYLFVLMDANAQTGGGIAGENERTMGEYGRNELNDNGRLLLTFATDNRLAVLNTFFDTRRSGIWHTFNGPSGRERRCLDYILTRQSHRGRVSNMEVVPQPVRPVRADSDHNIVVATVDLDGRLAHNRSIRTNPKRRQFNRQDLQVEAARWAVSQRFLCNLLARSGAPATTAQEMAKEFTEALLGAAETELFEEPRRRRTPECNMTAAARAALATALDKRRAARHAFKARPNAATWRILKAACKGVKATIATSVYDHLEGYVTELEAIYQDRDMRGLYQHLKRSTGLSGREAGRQQFLSYAHALKRVGCQSVEATVRQRRLLFAGAVARQPDGRLPKRLMFGELVGGEDPGQGNPEQNWLTCLKDDMKMFEARYGSTTDKPSVFGVPKLVWSEAAKVEGGVPWHAGVLQGAERFMASWHKGKEEASRQRAIKRGDSRPKNSLDTAPINGAVGGRKETARREESKREETDRVT